MTTFSKPKSDSNQLSSPSTLTNDDALRAKDVGFNARPVRRAPSRNVPGLLAANARVSAV